MYSIKVYKNGKESFSKNTNDEKLAGDIREKLENSCEAYTMIYGVSTALSVYKDDKEVYHVDWEY